MSRKVIYSILGAIIGAVGGAFLDLLIYLMLIGWVMNGSKGDDLAFGVLGWSMILLPVLVLIGGISCAVSGYKLAKRSEKKKQEQWIGE